MQSNEIITVTGKLKVTVFKEEELYLTYISPNLVVNGGKTLLRHLLMGDDTSNKKITRYAIGDSDLAAAVVQTSLQGSNTFAGLISTYSYPAYNQTQIDFFIDNTQANGISIKEFALFSENLTMFNRIVWNETLVKTSAFSLSGNFLISFS